MVQNFVKKRRDACSKDDIRKESFRKKNCAKKGENASEKCFLLFLQSFTAFIENL